MNETSSYREGIDYWNIDVDFFQNKKVRLLRGEFGIRGVYIYVLILNEIYRERGYYKKWDFDDCCLMSDSPGVAGDCSPNLIAEIVQGCVRRSLFDKRVFDVFGVLTSAEIQRRFLRIVGNSRDTISIIQEYFLLDTSNREDVTRATSAKLTFIPVALKDSSENFKVSSENFKDFDKGKESKGKERKENICGGQAATQTPRFIPPTVEEVAAYCRERRNGVDPRRFVDFYVSKGWMVGKNKMKDWKAAIRTWERSGSNNGQRNGNAANLAQQSAERDFGVKYD